MCTTKDIGELFIGKPDELVLAFDSIMTAVMQWQPNHVGASVHTIIFTNKKAWLIIRPMKKELDVKFYCDDRLESELIKKIVPYPNKSAHHLRVSHENEVTSEFLKLLREGFNYAMK